MSSHLYDWYDLCFICVHVVCIALLGECNLVTLHVCHLIWHYYGLDGIIHCKTVVDSNPLQEVPFVAKAEALDHWSH